MKLKFVPFRRKTENSLSDLRIGNFLINKVKVNIIENPRGFTNYFEIELFVSDKNEELIIILDYSDPYSYITRKLISKNYITKLIERLMPCYKWTLISTTLFPRELNFKTLKTIEFDI